MECSFLEQAPKDLRRCIFSFLDARTIAKLIITCKANQEDSFFENISVLELNLPQSRSRCIGAWAAFHQRCKNLEALKFGEQYVSTIYLAWEITGPEHLLRNNKSSLRHFDARSLAFFNVSFIQNIVSEHLNAQCIETLILGPGFSATRVENMAASKWPRIQRFVVPSHVLDAVDSLISNLGPQLRVFGTTTMMDSQQEANFFHLIRQPKFSQLRRIQFPPARTNSRPKLHRAQKYFPLWAPYPPGGDLEQWRSSIRETIPPKIPFSGIRFAERSLLEFSLLLQDGDPESLIQALMETNNTLPKLIAEFHGEPVISTQNKNLYILLLNALRRIGFGFDYAMHRIYEFVLDAAELLELGPEDEKLLGSIAYFSHYCHAIRGFEPRVVSLLKRSLGDHAHLLALQYSQETLVDLIQNPDYLNRFPTLSFARCTRWPHLKFWTALALLQCPKVDIFMKHEFEVPLIKWWLRRRNGIRCFTERFELDGLAEVFRTHKTKLQGHPFTKELTQYSSFYKRMLSHPALLEAFCECIQDVRSILNDSFVRFMIGSKRLDTLVNMTRAEAADVSWLGERVWIEALLLRYTTSEHALESLLYVRSTFPNVPESVEQFTSGARNFPVRKASHRYFIRQVLQEVLD